jgi:O-antigen ligase
VLCCYSVLSDFVGFTHYEAAAGRYFGALGDSVAWVLTLPLIVYFSTQRFALAAVAAAALVLTASRAPTLTVIASILLLIGFGRGRRFHYIAMLVVLLTIGLYQAGLFTTLLTRFSATELLANDRTATAAQGIKIFLTSPVVGRGYNALTYLYPSTGHRMALGILPAQTSMFVEVLSDWGILAFVPYICFVIASTVVGIALMHRSKDLPEGSFINGVVAWLLAILWANQSAVWFLVGSYLAPLVFGMAGLVAGSRARLKAAQGVARPDLSPQLQSALRSPAVGQ